MTLDWIHVVIAVVGFMMSGAIAVWRVSWVVAQAIATMKAEFNALLLLKEEELRKEIKDYALESDSKIGRVYQRFDDHKISVNSDFVRKEMCQVMHNSTATTIAEMKISIDKLTEKVDALLLRSK